MKEDKRDKLVNDQEILRLEGIRFSQKVQNYWDSLNLAFPDLEPRRDFESPRQISISYANGTILLFEERLSGTRLPKISDVQEVPNEFQGYLESWASKQEKRKKADLPNVYYLDLDVNLDDVWSGKVKQVEIAPYDHELMSRYGKWVQEFRNNWELEQDRSRYQTGWGVGLIVPGISVSFDLSADGKVRELIAFRQRQGASLTTRIKFKNGELVSFWRETENGTLFIDPEPELPSNYPRDQLYHLRRTSKKGKGYVGEIGYKWKGIFGTFLSTEKAGYRRLSTPENIEMLLSWRDIIL